MYVGDRGISKWFWRLHCGERETDLFRCGSHYYDPFLSEREIMETEVCNNELFVAVGVVPVAGSKGYQVAKVECDRLPFYGEKVARQVMPIVRDDPEQLGREVEERIVNFAKEMDLKVTIKCEVTKDPKLHRKEDCKYQTDTFFNLYVDMGSTNSKWMIASCNSGGHVQEIKVIERAKETAKLCADWGILYDKALAYTYNREDFRDWLCSAVLTFVRHVQEQRKEYAVNVYWAFPKLVAGIEASRNVDFRRLSEVVTERLGQYGLRGRFVLMPEAEALEAMFRNRVLHIAMASEEEIASNMAEAQAAEDHNNAENARVAQNRQAKAAAHQRYVAAKDKFDRDHSGFWGTIAGWFSAEPTEEYVPDYKANYQEVIRDRRRALKDFRTIGVNSKMPFGMLFLDAGGSTLDYCYIAKGSKNGDQITGSYLAGGKKVTECLMASLKDDDFASAEDRKCEFARRGTNPKIVEATKAVYDVALTDLAGRIGSHGQYLCVVCTGLAMNNASLRNLVREKLSLASNQRMIWSEDLVQIPDSAVTKYADIGIFKQIVCRLVKDGQAGPAYDVIGGLYFASEEGGRK